MRFIRARRCPPPLLLPPVCWWAPRRHHHCHWGDLRKWLCTLHKRAHYLITCAIIPRGWCIHSFFLSLSLSVFFFFFAYPFYFFYLNRATRFVEPAGQRSHRGSHARDGTARAHLYAFAKQIHGPAQSVCGRRVLSAMAAHQPCPSPDPPLLEHSLPFLSSFSPFGNHPLPRKKALRAPIPYASGSFPPFSSI